VIALFMQAFLHSFFSWFPTGSVQQLSGLPGFYNIIDGEKVSANKRLSVINPATGKQLAAVPDVDRTLLNKAISAETLCISVDSLQKSISHAKGKMVGAVATRVGIHLRVKRIRV
jgi:hypothetical protein